MAWPMVSRSRRSSSAALVMLLVDSTCMSGPFLILSSIQAASGDCPLRDLEHRDGAAKLLRSSRGVVVESLEQLAGRLSGQAGDRVEAFCAVSIALVVWNVAVR